MNEKEVRAIALGLVLPHFPDAKIIAVRDYPVQEAEGKQQKAPSPDKAAPKLPHWHPAAKRSAPSKD